MNLRQENRSKLSFTARIITKYSLKRFLSICGEKMSKDFLKFCKLISNLMFGQIIVSNLTNVHRLNSRINYARLHWIRYKAQTSNTIITPAYHSRCSSWKVSSKASIASEFSSKVKNENDAIRNRISEFDKRRISQPINKLATNNRILLIAAVFHVCTSSRRRQLKKSQVDTKLCQLQPSK